MKKLCSAALVILSLYALRIAAFADIAPLPEDYIQKERLHNALESPVLPLVLIIVIVAVVILIKVLRSKKK